VATAGKRVSHAFLGTAWLIGLALIGRGAWLRSVRSPPGVRVSVIVPARDEAKRLPRLLSCLADTNVHELIVVDDDSRDATASVAVGFGAKVLSVGEPPPGWTPGKAWACATGAAVATGQVLVFFDADVEPTSAGIDALVAAASESNGLVSAQPSHRIEQWYERASAGPALVTLLGAGTGTTPARRWWRDAVAFGPAIAVDRRVYHSFGGHAAARVAVDDDLALARAARSAGVPVVALLGGALLRYRMYPGGIAQLVEGWTKNLASGAIAIPPARLIACIVWVTAALSAPFAGVVVYLAFAAQVHVVLRRAGRFGVVMPFLYPVALIVFVALFGLSTIATTARRRVRWRGRDVPVGRRS
jgi:4,4'-diaponeurosporenoate glycosyltransferase